MNWILYVLLVLAVAGDILLAVVLAKVMHKNDEPQQKIDTADDFVRAVTPVLQSETDLLAEQLRAMQGESARTTTATLRDFSAVLAENQRQRWKRAIYILLITKTYKHYGKIYQPLHRFRLQAHIR